MKRLGLLFGIAFVLLMASSAQATTPYYLFGMSSETFVYLNSSITSTMTLNSFHATSETWNLYIRANTNDNPPYDNLTWTVDCTSGDTATFDTLEYSSWVNDGYIQIAMNYEDAAETIHYNAVPLTAKAVTCDFTISDWNATNNTANYRMWAEMIPFYATIEFIECEGFEDNFGISFTGQVTTVVTMMEDGWEIAWYTYSIFIIIFAVVGVPILVFIVVRWAIYRISGFKLIERRER